MNNKDNKELKGKIQALVDEYIKNEKFHDINNIKSINVTFNSYPTKFNCKCKECGTFTSNFEQVYETITINETEINSAPF